MAQIDELKEVVRRLRAKDGCPWDMVQTHETLKPELIEEASEVLSGINVYLETGNGESLKEELGDLLLQIVFHASLAEDALRNRCPHLRSPVRGQRGCAS